jgi:hypothetical protein
VIGDRRAFIRLLADQEEIVVIGDQSLVDQSTCGWVSELSLIALEEPFAVFDVDHDGGDVDDKGRIAFLEFGPQHVQVLIVVDGDLIASAGVEEDQQFDGRALIAVAISLHAFEGEVEHGLELALGFVVDLVAGVERREGRIQCGSSRHDGLAGRFGCIEA